MSARPGWLLSCQPGLGRFQACLARPVRGCGEKGWRRVCPGHKNHSVIWWIAGVAAALLVAASVSMYFHRVRSWARRWLRGLPLLPAVCLAVAGGVAIVLLATWILRYIIHTSSSQPTLSTSRSCRSRWPAAWAPPSLSSLPTGDSGTSSRGDSWSGSALPRLNWRPRCCRTYRRRIPRWPVSPTNPPEFAVSNASTCSAATCGRLIPRAGVQSSIQARSHRTAHCKRRITLRGRSSRAASEIPSKRKEVRATIVRVIADHLRDHEYSWSAYDFDFRTAHLEDVDFSRVVFGGTTDSTQRRSPATPRSRRRLLQHRLVPRGDVLRQRLVPRGDVLRPCRVREATFSGHAIFHGATFSANASFDEATFSGRAVFDEATFSGHAGFDRATFSGEAWFDRATFSGDASFGMATFSRDAEFAGATFTGYAGFAGLTFSGAAVFERATFSGYAWFEGATFSDRAGFAGATFSSDAGFQRATFSSDAWFERATFSGYACFERATFSASAWFGAATFAGRTSFAETDFGHGVRIEFAHPRQWGPPAPTFDWDGDLSTKPENVTPQKAGHPHRWPENWNYLNFWEFATSCRRPAVGLSPIIHLAIGEYPNRPDARPGAAVPGGTALVTGPRRSDPRPSGPWVRLLSTSPVQVRYTLGTHHGWP